MNESSRGIPALAGLDAIASELEDLYRDVHAHPELSMQEHRTAAMAAERLRAAGYEVTDRRRRHRRRRRAAPTATARP